MFAIGDVIIYSTHGLCEIDDICEKTFSDDTKMYYVLHPMGQQNLKINVPIDSNAVAMLKPMNREEAEEILNSFNELGIDWIEDAKLRNSKYHELVGGGKRKDIAGIANTLMRKNIEFTEQKKKLYVQDRKLLDTIQAILFHELALSLEASFENISEQVNNMIESTTIRSLESNSIQ